jgi:hypothetical protein
MRQRFFANDRDSDVGLEPRTASTQVPDGADAIRVAPLKFKE